MRLRFKEVVLLSEDEEELFNAIFFSVAVILSYSCKDVFTPSDLDVAVEIENVDSWHYTPFVHFKIVF